MPELRVTIVADQLLRRPTSGIATYTRGLLQGLRALDGDAPAVVLAASRGGRSLAELGWPVRASRLPGPVMTRLWDRGAAIGSTAGRLTAGRLTGRLTAGADVVHATSLVAPAGGAEPLVVMVHDLAWREVPGAFPPRGRRWHEAALRRAIRHAALLVTPSQRTAALLTEAGADPERVVVIAEGCDHLPTPDGVGAAGLLRSRGVVTPYLLSVSTLEPRKNLERLLEAYGRARPRLPEPWPLVVVGPPGWGPALRPVPGAVLVGVVSDAILAGLYAGARCLAYVPLVEGWGLPAVEAMAAGTPVVASPMPSTAGAALEVDPRDVEAIADALATAAGEGRRRTELLAAGDARARSLTWEDAARRHTEAWADAVRQRLP